MAGRGERRRSSCATSPSRSGRWSRCAPAASRSSPARSTRWSARTAPASRRWSRSSPGCTAATRASSCSTARRRLRLDRRVQGRRRRGDLPGADALPRPLGHREHLHGPPAAAAAAAASTAARCTPRRERCSPGSASTSTPAARRSASPSPTSRSSRSPRPSRSTRGVLIMDEPTAALSGVEVERLFAVARSLRDEGRALVFISHRFDEVFALCDTVTVMRDGDVRRHRRRSPRPTSTRSSR